MCNLPIVVLSSLSPAHACLTCLQAPGILLLVTQLIYAVCLHYVLLSVMFTLCCLWCQTLEDTHLHAHVHTVYPIIIAMPSLVLLNSAYLFVLLIICCSCYEWSVCLLKAYLTNDSPK